MYETLIRCRYMASEGMVLSRVDKFVLFMVGKWDAGSLNSEWLRKVHRRFMRLPMTYWGAPERHK